MAPRRPRRGGGRGVEWDGHVRAAEAPLPLRRAGAVARRAAARAPLAGAAPARAAGAASARSFEQRHLDVIGLSLVALGVYLTFVLYLGWDGGKVGAGAETGALLPARQGRLRGARWRSSSAARR